MTTIFMVYPPLSTTQLMVIPEASLCVGDSDRHSLAADQKSAPAGVGLILLTRAPAAVDAPPYHAPRPLDRARPGMQRGSEERAQRLDAPRERGTSIRWPHRTVRP